MSRPRSKPVAQTVTPTVTPTERNGYKMAGMDNAAILALLSKTRQKGVYTDRLNEFITSEEAGICVNDTWADLGGKRASTLKQGFEAAKEKKEALDGADKVIVKTDKTGEGDNAVERVYLINLAHVEGVEVPA